MLYKATCTFAVVATVPGATTFTVALALFVESFLLVTVTVTVVLCPEGAVKLPFASTVPAVVDHVTPVVSFVVTVNEVVCPVPMAAVCGLTDKVIGAGGIDEPHPPIHIDTPRHTPQTRDSDAFLILGGSQVLEIPHEPGHRYS
jgi:hypothetical protein